MKLFSRFPLFCSLLAAVFSGASGWAFEPVAGVGTLVLAGGYTPWMTLPVLLSGTVAQPEPQSLVANSSLSLAPGAFLLRETDASGEGTGMWSGTPSVGTIRPPGSLPGSVAGVIRLDPREWDGTFNGGSLGAVPPANPTPPDATRPPLLRGGDPISSPDVTPVLDSRNPLQLAQAEQRTYRLSVMVPRMRVGSSLGYSMIVIERPSPGDDYWYRLPYTITVQGVLPDGIQLVQKGPLFHDLARFEGVPTRAGTYSVTLQATMADGLKTAEVPVVFDVAEAGAFAFVSALPWGRTRFVSGEILEGDAAISIATDLGTFEEGAEEVFSLQASGLPPGLAYEKQRGGGTYVLTGMAQTAGTYPVSVQWGRNNEAPLARAEVLLEILPADYVPSKRAVVSYWGGPLKKAVRYEEGRMQTATFLVEDDLGRRSQEGFKLVAEGLPKGLSLASPAPYAATGFVGSPQESGTFSVRVRAVFEDGTESEAVEYALQVESPLDVSLAVGSYDCLVGRSVELNANNGGRLLVTLGRNGALSGYLLNNFKRYPFASRDAQIDEESGEVIIAPPGSGMKFSGWIEEDTQGYSSAEQPVYVLRGVLSGVEAQEQLGVYAMRAAPRGRGAASSRYASQHPINLMVVHGSPFYPTEQVPGAPVGIGFSALRISPSGLVSATVWAADGSAPVTTSTRLCETSGFGARFNTYFALNNSSGKSGLQGSLFMNEDGDAAGQMDWFQNASDRGAFPEGIPLVQYEGVIGSRMAPQPSGLNLEGFEEGLQNAELDFIGAAGESEDVIPLTVDKKSIQPALLAAAPSAEAGPTASNVRIRYNAKTGVLTGSLVWKDGETGAVRPVSFRGMRAPDGKALMGHFTAPESGNSKRLEAGQILIQPSR